MSWQMASVGLAQQLITLAQIAPDRTFTKEQQDLSKIVICHLFLTQFTGKVPENIFWNLKKLLIIY